MRRAAVFEPYTQAGELYSRWPVYHSHL